MSSDEISPWVLSSPSTHNLSNQRLQPQPMPQKLNLSPLEMQLRVRKQSSTPVHLPLRKLAPISTVITKRIIKHKTPLFGNGSTSPRQLPKIDIGLHMRNQATTFAPSRQQTYRSPTTQTSERIKRKNLSMDLDPHVLRPVEINRMLPDFFSPTEEASQQQKMSDHKQKYSGFRGKINRNLLNWYVVKNLPVKKVETTPEFNMFKTFDL